MRSSVFAVLVLVTSSLGFAGSADARSARKTVDEFDKVFPLAIKEGKAIVVVAVPNLDRKYPTSADWENALANDVSDTGVGAAIDNSMLVEWRDTENADKRIVVGRNKSVTEVGTTGYFLKFNGAGLAGYYVYVIDPGQYRISRITYNLPRAKNTGDDLGLPNGHAESPVGSLQMVSATFTETQIESRYHDDEYETIPRHMECGAVLVNGGECVEMVWVESQRILRRPAGYYPTPVFYQVPGLMMRMAIDRDFASFAAKPGEAIVIDGLSVEPPAATFAQSDCDRTDEKTLFCALMEIHLLRSAAALPEVRGADFVAMGYPRLGEILRGATYRALDMKGMQTGKSPMGDIVTLSE